jgi:predicted RecA/RadA family phage recombinase
MKLNVKPGQIITLTAPSGGVVSGTAYVIGHLVVVATEDKAQTLDFEALVRGVCDLPKVADEIWTENMKVYFDSSESKFTLDPDTATNPLVGVAVNPIPASVSLATSAAADDLTVEGSVITVLDYTGLALDTITVTIGSTSTVLTEGTDWDNEVDNETTANNIATAVAAIDGATATVDTDDAEVTVVPGTGATDLDPAVGRVRLDGAAR